jgi:hypothetical protein
MNNNINRIQSSVKLFQPPLSLRLEIASFTSHERLVDGDNISFNENSSRSGTISTLVEIPSVAHSDHNLLSLSNRILLTNSQSSDDRTGRLSVNALASSHASHSDLSVNESIRSRCYLTVEDVQLAPVSP